MKATPEQLALAAGLCVAGYGLALATWPARRASRGGRIAVFVAAASVLVSLPFALTAPPQLRFLPAVILGSVLVCKLFDALTDTAWRQRTFAEWARFLVHPVVLVYRLHLLEPPRPLRDNVATLARGLVTIVAGHAFYGIWLWTGWGRETFWLEHLGICIAVYLIFLDGGNVFVCGLLRVLGSNVTDLSRTPVLAVSPADFWRRYNRNAMQFFAEDVFKAVGGRRNPVRAVVLTFGLNGLLHEYFIAVATGRITGYMLAFFLCAGVGTALTYRWRPRSIGAIALGRAATVAFNVLTGVFFFAAVDAVFPLYRVHRLLP